MKYQPQHDVIDPELPSPDTAFEHDGNHDPDVPDDAYVIGEDGNSFRAVGIRTGSKAKKGFDRWAAPIAFGLVTLCLVLTFWNLSRLVQGPPPPPTPSPFQVKQALYLGVMKIDAYRRVHGVTPDTLVDAGLPDTSGYSYRRIDLAHYVVSFEVNGSKLEYDSSDPKERFFGTPQEMLTMGDSK
jgi:hypothetical protein